ncbi:hypothetical protein F383_13229 [Gossypium arboreum]|uniref:Uncharacterized protein n=1 Tax=Gossypium arboreum TaxID=29729 RepID=A0A0B0Q1L8_GOSAR|nr:hypothetical protein F383_13229 [Gossypium arboreum]
MRNGMEILEMINSSMLS